MRPSFLGNSSFKLWQYSKNVHHEFENWILQNEYKFRKMNFAHEYKNSKNDFCTMNTKTQKTNFAHWIQKTQNSKNDLHDMS